MANELASAQVSPQAAPQAEPPAGSGFPSPLADVEAGSVPAISMAPIREGKMDEIQKFTVENFDAILQSGLEYHDLPDAHSVLFNPKLISIEQIEAADKAGKLFEVAPLAKGLGTPATAQAPSAEAQPAPAASNAGPLSGATVSAPVPANKGLESARIKASRPAPATGSNPVPNQLGRRAL